MKTKTKIKKQNRVLFAIVGVIFALYCLTLLYPFWFMLINSFKTNWDFLDNVFNFPKTWLFSNYSEAFFKYNFPVMFLNSFLLTGLGTIASLFFTTVTAYIVARYDFFGKKVLWVLVTSMMLVPSIGTLSATYTIMYRLRLVNNIFGVVLLYSAPFGMNFLLLYGYFKSIPASYAEAAKIDGAGHTVTMFLVMLPQVGGGIATIALLLFIGFWNDYMTPYLYLPRVATIAVSIDNLAQNASAKGEYTQMFAGMTIALIPIVALYFAFQKRILSATLTGGLKG